MLVLSINLKIWQRVRLREKKHISKEHLYNFGLNKIFELKFLGRVPRKTHKKMLLYNKFEGYCSEMLSPHNFNGIALTSFGIFVFTNGLFFYFCKQGLLEIMTSKVTKIYRYHNDSKRQEQNQELPFHSHPTHPTQLGCSSLSGSEYNVSYPVTSPLLGMASLGFKAKCAFP